MTNLKEKFYNYIQNKKDFKNTFQWYKNSANIDLNDYREAIQVDEFINNIYFIEFFPISLNEVNLSKEELIKHIQDKIKEYDETYTYTVFDEGCVGVYQNKIAKETDEQVIKKLSNWYSAKNKEDKQYKLYLELKEKYEKN